MWGGGEDKAGCFAMSIDGLSSMVHEKRARSSEFEELTVEELSFLKSKTWECDTLHTGLLYHKEDIEPLRLAKKAKREAAENQERRACAEERRFRAEEEQVRSWMCACQTLSNVLQTFALRCAR